MTLAWPAEIRHWDIMYPPKEYLFENYYDEMYDSTRTRDRYNPVGLFCGLSSRFCEKSQADNAEKIRRYRYLVDKHVQDKLTYQAYCKHYALEYGEYPSFVVEQNGKSVRLHTPKYIEIPVQSVLRIPVQFHRKDASDRRAITVFCTVTDPFGAVSSVVEGTLSESINCYYMPVYGTWLSGNCIMNITTSVGHQKARASVKVKMV